MNDSPTVTYTPMAGERFARSLMMPIPPSVILNLIQAGTPVDEIFRISVQSVNGIDNRRVGRLFVRRANPEFYPSCRTSSGFSRRATSACASSRPIKAKRNSK